MQYNDYVHPTVTPAFAWVTIVLLCLIDPPGKLESTIHGLKMHCIKNNVCIITQDIQLGGVYSQILRGPTPQNLVTPAAAAAMNPVPTILAVPPVRPWYTHASAATATAVSWMG